MNSAIAFVLTALLSAPTQSGLQVAASVIDRGEVKSGAPLIQRFELRNPGAATVTITEVVSGCGCSKPKVSRREILAGESTELLVDINTLSQAPGPNAWTTTVRYASDSAVGELELRIKAMVVREVSIEPVALGLTIDRETTHTFTLTDRRVKPLTITAVHCSSTEIRTQLTATGSNAAGERIQQVRVTIREAFPPGRFSETLVLATDDDLYRELRVPIMVNRRLPGQVMATPAQVDLRLAKGQSAASALVRLRDADGQTVVVDRLEVDNPAIHSKWAVGPGSMVTLRLGVESSSPGQGIVKVHLKEPRPQTLVIPVEWRSP